MAAGKDFLVTVQTVGGTGCIRADGSEVALAGNQARLTEVGRGYARAQASSWPNSGSIHFSEPELEGLQLMRQSLGRRRAPYSSGPFHARRAPSVALTR